MKHRSTGRSIAHWLAGAAGLGTASYAIYAGMTWCRYGSPGRPGKAEDRDALLDRFLPAYEAAERHSRRVAAPAEIALAAARELDLSQSIIVQSLFKTREWILGGKPRGVREAQPLLAQMESLGWRVLAEIPGREIVVGAATQPWKAEVVFQGMPPEKFAAFDQPGFVKIAWTLRADPIGSSEAVLRTETRVTTTDSTARRKFRNYWSLIRPGVVLVRLALMSMGKREAERRARAALLRPNS